MILKKRLSQVEKFLIENANDDNYSTRYCNDHGVFQKRQDVDDGKCIYCKKQCEVIENLKEIQEKL
jgi:hypothetical protein